MTDENDKIPFTPQRCVEDKLSRTYRNIEIDECRDIIDKSIEDPRVYTIEISKFKKYYDLYIEKHEAT